MYCYVDVDEHSVLKYQKLASRKNSLNARDGKVPCYVQLGNESGFPHQGVIDFHRQPRRSDDRHAAGSRRVGKQIGAAHARLLCAAAHSRAAGDIRRCSCRIQPSATIRTSATCWSWIKTNKVEVRPVQLGALFGGLRSIVFGHQTGRSGRHQRTDARSAGHRR